MNPQQLAEQLKQSLGDSLSCVLLFGSAVTGDFVPGVSNYNVLLVTDRLDVATLDRLMPIVRGWVRSGNRPPLLFTPAEIAAALDSFPIEFLEIQKFSEVLVGTNPLENAQVSVAHLRLQLEREFRGKLLAMREGYLRTAGKTRHILSLLVESLPGVLAVFRGALSLLQDSTPSSKADVIRSLAEGLSADPEPWLTVEAIKRRERSSRQVDAVRLFGECLQFIEQVAVAVDRHEP